MKINATCPECGYLVDDASGIGAAEGARPEPGDLAVCIRCAGLGYYETNQAGTELELRLLTEQEKVELSDNEELTKVRAAIVGQSVWMNP